VWLAKDRAGFLAQLRKDIALPHGASYGDCQGFGRRIRLPGSRGSGLHPVGTLEQIKTC